MKIKFNEFLNENHNDEINDFLDKITDLHIINLSVEDEKFINKHNIRDIIIEDIKYIIDSCDLSVSMGEIQAESCPAISDYELIERLYSDEVEVVEYGGYKNEEEVGSYSITYEQLETSILLDIRYLLMMGIYNELILNDDNETIYSSDNIMTLGQKRILSTPEGQRKFLTENPDKYKNIEKIVTPEIREEFDHLWSGGEMGLI